MSYVVPVEQAGKAEQPDSGSRDFWYNNTLDGDVDDGRSAAPQRHAEGGSGVEETDYNGCSPKPMGDSRMPHSFIKAGVAVCALGGIALVGPAHAISPLPFNDVAPLAIPVIDEETAVEEMERPDEVPPGSQEEAAPPKAAAPEAPAQGEGQGGDAEEQELKRAFPETNWPKE